MKLPDSPRNPNVCVCVGLCVCMKTRKKTLDCKHQPEGLRSLLAWQHAEWMAVCVCVCVRACKSGGGLSRWTVDEEGSQCLSSALSFIG